MNNGSLFIVNSSGTSGVSKKVILSHEAFLALAEVEAIDLHLNPQSIINIDRWGISALRKIYWARASGAKLAMYPGPHKTKTSLRYWIGDSHITHLSLLASTFRWVCQGLFKFRTVQVLEVGGEMVDWEDVRLARECFPNAIFMSRYACVEAHVISRKRIPQSEPIGKGRLPVGRPIKHVEVEIVGSPMGEIKVRSPYIALGYYNNPELSAAKFKDGWVLTGDLGFFKDGELYHCGRKDFQGETRAKFNIEDYLREQNRNSALHGGEVR